MYELCITCHVCADCTQLEYHGRTIFTVSNIMKVMRLLVCINLTVAYAAYADHWRHAYMHPTLLTHETNLGQTPSSYDVRGELQRGTLSPVRENACGHK